MKKEMKWDIGQDAWHKIRRMFVLDVESKKYRTPHTNFLEKLYNNKEDYTLDSPIVLEVLSDLLESYESIEEFKESLDRKINELRKDAFGRKDVK